MSPPEIDVATLSYRIDRLERDQGQIARDAETMHQTLAVHQEQINGSGGVVNALERLSRKVDSLNRALYAFAGSFIIAAITIAIAIGGGH